MFPYVKKDAGSRSKKATSARWSKVKYPEGSKKCTKCDLVKKFDSFHRHKACKDGFNTVCKECRLPLSKNTYHQTPIALLIWQGAKRRSQVKGVEFSITPEDVIVPELCPVLGVKLARRTEFAPTLDRIIPSKGHVRGNIAVISARANAMKYNSSPEEIVLLRDYIKKMTGI